MVLVGETLFMCKKWWTQLAEQLNDDGKEY